MSKKKSKLSTVTQNLLNMFEEDAGLAYWESDQGSPDSARKADHELQKSRHALEKRLMRMESELKQLRKQVKELKVHLDIHTQPMSRK